LDVGFGFETVFGGLSDRGEVGFEQRAVEGAGASAGRGREADAHIDVAARNAALDEVAQSGFECVELGRSVHMEVEGAVVDAFQRHDDFATFSRASGAGKACHAARGHAFGIELAMLKINIL
jgi:hypothetical protein